MKLPIGINHTKYYITKDPDLKLRSGSCRRKRQLPTLTPTWGNTIGDDGLNCSVRNGKRWIPVAIATVIYGREK